MDFHIITMALVVLITAHLAAIVVASMDLEVSVNNLIYQ